MFNLAAVFHGWSSLNVFVYSTSVRRANESSREQHTLKWKRKISNWRLAFFFFFSLNIQPHTYTHTNIYSIHRRTKPRQPVWCMEQNSVRWYGEYGIKMPYRLRRSLKTIYACNPTDTTNYKHFLNFVTSLTLLTLCLLLELRRSKRIHWNHH